MNTKILTFLFIGFLTVFQVAAQLEVNPNRFNQEKTVINKASAAGTIEIGYSTNEIATSIGVGAGASLKAGVIFPASALSAYVGSKIIKLKVGIGSGTTSNAKVYISYDKDSDPIYTQDVKFNASSWNEIILTTPYTIEAGKDLFIGYSLTAGTTNYYPIAVDAGPSNQYSDWIYYSGQWSRLGDNDFSNNICLKAVLAGENLPKYGLSISPLSVPKYVKSGTPFSVSHIIKNTASEKITNFDLSYKIGNDPIVTKHISGIALENGKNDTITLNDLYVSKTGQIPLITYVSKPNGNKFSTVSNDTVNTSFVTSINNYLARKVLLENFTTTKCVYCPAAHTRWEQTLSTRSNVISVAQHVGYGTDVFTITESQSYLWFYGASTYAPAAMLDRTNLYASGADGAATTPVFYPGDVSVLGKLVDERLSTPAFISVGIDKKYNAADNSLKLTVSGKAIQGFEAKKNIKLNIYIAEDSLIASQTGAGAKYQHDHVIRDAITATWGDAISLNTTDSTYSATYNYTLNSAWNPKKITVIAFLSSYDSDNVNNCEVYNAEAVSLISASETAVDETFIDQQNRIYTNGNILKIDGEFRTAYVYDLAGKPLAEIDPLHPEITLKNKGAYIVKVANNHSQTSKVILIK